MKKFSWMVALLIALSLALVGCPGGGGGSGGPPGGPPGGDGPEVVSLPPFNLVLADNFEYGEGYQGLVENTKLFPDGAITAGDVYTMKITFTVSRALEDVITVGLVDRTPPPDGDYWIPLSYDKDDDEWELEDDDAPAIAATVAEAAAGEVTKVITFTALNSALSAAASANCIAFETQGAGTPGTGGSGTSGPVTLSFTEFFFVKGTEADLEGAQPAEPEPEPELPAGAISLGTYTYGLGDGDTAGGESQIKWGDKNSSSTPTVAQLQAATDLVIVTENPVAGGTQLIYQTATGYSDWHSSNITTDSGGTTSIATVSDDKKTITVHLAQLTDYSANFAEATGIRIILAYYTGATKAHSLGEVIAYIIPE